MPSSTSIIPKRVNPDLEKERKAASFDLEEFAIWWYGGPQKLKFKRELNDLFFNNTISEENFLNKSHEDIYEQGVKDSLNVARKLQQLQQKHNPGGTDIWPDLFPSDLIWGAMPSGNPFGVQFVMALHAIKSQGTDEQYEKFGKRMEKFQICGTYAQTELGHGTYLRGLETRADYDRQTEQFILNSPTITAYKWWPGGLGHSSNYCIVMAQLYIDNVSKGLQMFVVQVRDEETHLPLPGVDIGDIGKKMVFHGVNNGFLGLKNVRIPRLNMLMRNAQVLPDGTFKKSPVSQLTYLTMLYTRCVIVDNASKMLAMGATIATRYAAVRRQSPINPNEPEPQIMDHVTQQLKLFPEIANAIATHLAVIYLWDLYHQTYAETAQQNFARLPEMHALTCALKVVCTADAAEGIERLRLACGGHGYLVSAQLGPLAAGASAACTYEGENTVLLLQVGRFLMKSWRSIKAAEKLTPTVAYLEVAAKQTEFGKFSGNWQNLVQLIQYTAANKTRLAFESLTSRLQAGVSEAEAANLTGIELTQAATLHGRAFLCETFYNQVTGASANTRSAGLNKVLEHLLELYLVHTTLKYLSDVLRFVRLSEADVRSLQNRLEDTLKRIRPDAVAICDGFNFHDRTLRSTLGSYDGNVYERLFEDAKNSPLNQQPVPKAFHQYLKPFFKANL